MPGFFMTGGCSVTVDKPAVLTAHHQFGLPRVRLLVGERRSGAFFSNGM
jgi:hypothetical protein